MTMLYQVVRFAETAGMGRMERNGTGLRQQANDLACLGQWRVLVSTILAAVLWRE